MREVSLRAQASLECREPTDHGRQAVNLHTSMAVAGRPFPSVGVGAAAAEGPQPPQIGGLRSCDPLSAPMRKVMPPTGGPVVVASRRISHPAYRERMGERGGGREPRMRVPSHLAPPEAIWPFPLRVKGLSPLPSETAKNVMFNGKLHDFPFATIRVS